MCDSCLAHQEWRDAVDKLITKLPPGKEHLSEFDHPYMEIVAEIPGSLPDGTGIFTPISWVRWAKKHLGYESAQHPMHPTGGTVSNSSREEQTPSG